MLSPLPERRDESRADLARREALVALKHFAHSGLPGTSSAYDQCRGVQSRLRVEERQTYDARWTSALAAVASTTGIRRRGPNIADAFYELLLRTIARVLGGMR